MSSLPYAHNLWKCAFAADFEEGKWSGAWGRRFFESLTDKQFLACSYHQIADWQSVAKISVQLFRRFRSQPMSNLDAAMSQLTLEEQDRLHLYLLFHEPIVWGGKAPYVTNGQHRICAIRASGARLCVIDHNKFDPMRKE